MNNDVPSCLVWYVKAAKRRTRVDRSRITVYGAQKET